MTGARLVLWNHEPSKHGGNLFLERELYYECSSLLDSNAHTNRLTGAFYLTTNLVVQYL